jgi:hypothetical protein
MNRGTFLETNLLGAPRVQYDWSNKANLYLGFFRQQGTRTGRENVRDPNALHTPYLNLSREELAMKLPSDIQNQRS